jgi:hypothetical protein
MPPNVNRPLRAYGRDANSVCAAAKNPLFNFNAFVIIVKYYIQSHSTILPVQRNTHGINQEASDSFVRRKRRTLVA